MVVNMPSPWYEATGYDTLHQALVGAGSIMDASLPYPAIDRYLAAYPADDLFFDYVDVVVGMLTPYTRVRPRLRGAAVRERPGPDLHDAGAAERKQEMQARAW
jgi:hypothetical protein